MGRKRRTTPVGGEPTVFYERAVIRPIQRATDEPKTAPSLTQPTPSIFQRWHSWRNKNSNRHTLEAWIILTPILLYYFIFNIVPIFLNIAVSFMEWRGVFLPPQYIGLENYKRYLVEPYPQIIGNTIVFAVVTLALQTVLAFLIAVMLNKKFFGRGVVRATWYIPTLTSAAIMAQIAFVFISPFDGVFNAILDYLGQEPVIWPLNALAMRVFIVLFQVWRGIGVPIVLFLAALQGIHPELYDAAAVDGANGRQLLRYVTIPLLRPMIVFILVTGIINGFQIFEASLLITKGGPSNATNVMLLQIYNDAFTNFNLGVASAGTVIMAVILLWFSISGIRLMSAETR